jgi:hypothetical protein
MTRDGLVPVCATVPPFSLPEKPKEVKKRTRKKVKV